LNVLNKTKKLTRDEARVEIIKVFKRFNDNWFSAGDVKEHIDFELEENDWTYIVRELFNTGKIDRRGSYAHSQYRWIGE
jgi:hypothetical protein